MRWIIALLLLSGVAQAETVAANRVIRTGTVIEATDLILLDRDMPEAVRDPAEVIGQEARRTLYANRPLRPEDIGPPRLIDRNQIVPLSFAGGGLSILTEGRALASGGAGEVIRIMNLSSRTTVSGRILADGSVVVGPAP